MSTTSVSPKPPTPSPSLPPSARDFLAYERIVLDSASTRQVAAELKISQTRVRQVVRRVADWLPNNLPEHNETRDAAQLRLAQYIVADRLQRYLVEVSRAWQQTHESKYMTAILRILTAQSKLPAHPGTLEALAAEAILGPLEDSSTCEEQAASDSTPRGAGLWPAATPPLSPSPPPPLSPSPSVPSPNSPLPTPSQIPPPSEACSPSPPSTCQTITKNTTAPAPNPEPSITFASSANTSNRARRAFLAPAHPREPHDDATITELKITPQKLGLQTSQPSSRRDRRRLKRLLAK